MTKATPNPCSLIRSNEHPGKGTVLVLGIPRGGTSVVAGICHMLGVPMGLDIDPANMEDREFHQMLRHPDVQSAAVRYFARLRDGRQLAGAKNPVVIDHLADFFPVISEPVLIVVSRDVYATAQREEISGNEFFSSLREAIRRKYAILEFVETADAPLLVVSYERLMMEPARAVTSIARFLIGTVDAELVRLASEGVRPHADMPRNVNFVDARRRYEETLPKG
jgi:hypothetical protein